MTFCNSSSSWGLGRYHVHLVLIQIRISCFWFPCMAETASENEDLCLSHTGELMIYRKLRLCFAPKWGCSDGGHLSSSAILRTNFTSSLLMKLLENLNHQHLFVQSDSYFLCKCCCSDVPVMINLLLIEAAVVCVLSDGLCVCVPGVSSKSCQIRRRFLKHICFLQSENRPLMQIYADWLDGSRLGEKSRWESRSDY